MDDDARKYLVARQGELEAWLDEHIRVFVTPETVGLSHFEVDWDTFYGSFRITLDEVTLIDRFKFSPEQSGKPVYFTPMFGSPLGVPCSYSAIELTEFTRLAISMCLAEVIPRSGRNGNTDFLSIQKSKRATANGISMTIIEAYLKWMKQRKKCSPNPEPWNAFWQLLNAQQKLDSRLKVNIPTPLKSGSGNEKLKRLGEQLRSAQRQGYLDNAMEYLEELPRRDWVFCDEHDWG